MRPSARSKLLADRAQVFSALGDPTRLALLTRLATEGPGSTAQLSAESALTRQAVSKHLSVLESARLVSRSRAGRELRWRIEPRRFDDAQEFMQRVSAQWDEVLSRIKASLE